MDGKETPRRSDLGALSEEAKMSAAPAMDALSRTEKERLLGLLMHDFHMKVQSSLHFTSKWRKDRHLSASVRGGSRCR